MFGVRVKSEGNEVQRLVFATVSVTVVFHAGVVVIWLLCMYVLRVGGPVVKLMDFVTWRIHCLTSPRHVSLEVYTLEFIATPVN